MHGLRSDSDVCRVCGVSFAGGGFPFVMGHGCDTHKAPKRSSSIFARSCGKGQRAEQFHVASGRVLSGTGHGKGFIQLLLVIAAATCAVANIPAFFVVAATAVVAVTGFPFVGHHCCGVNRCDDCYFASLIGVAEVVYLVVDSTLL